MDMYRLVDLLNTTKNKDQLKYLVVIEGEREVGRGSPKGDTNEATLRYSSL
jgi:hypothetical protein